MYTRSMVEKQSTSVVGNYQFNFQALKKNTKLYVQSAGLFDVSHMGEVEVKGVDSLAFLQRVVTNDVSTLKVGAHNIQLCATKMVVQ